MVIALSERKDMCGKGLHLMEGNSREVKGGGRECIPCKAERGRRQNRQKKLTELFREMGIKE